MIKSRVPPEERARVRRQAKATWEDVDFTWVNFQRMKEQLPELLAANPLVKERLAELGSHLFEAKKQVLLLQALLEKLMPTRQGRKKLKDYL